jgi:hypothetical protein
VQGLRQLPEEGSQHSKTATDRAPALAAALRNWDCAGREEQMFSQLWTAHSERPEAVIAKFSVDPVARHAAAIPAGVLLNGRLPRSLKLRSLPRRPLLALAALRDLAEAGPVA